MEASEPRQDSFLQRYDEVLHAINDLTSVRKDGFVDDEECRTVDAQDAVHVTLDCVRLLEKALGLSDHYAHLENQLNTKHIENEHPAQEMNEDDTAVNVLVDLLSKSDEMKDKVSRIILERVRIRSSQILQCTAKHVNQLSHSDAAIQALPDTKEFENLYLETFTNAFGDELDQFRQESSFSSKDVSHLVSSIQMGADIFTDSQKEMLLFAKSQAQ